MVYDVIIVEDEPLAISVLKNYIAQVKELRLKESFCNGISAGTYLGKQKIDIVFLDINMPRLNGIDFINHLSTKPMVVMTTAYKEYASLGFELDVIDYLVKPFSFPRFLKAVKKCISSSHLNPEQDFERPNHRQSMFVKIDRKKFRKIYLDEITVIESLKDYIRIFTTTGARLIVHKNLRQFTEELPADQFKRIHRSYTVALDKIEVVDGNSVKIGDKSYTIGRNYMDAKKQILGIEPDSDL